MVENLLCPRPQARISSSPGPCFTSASQPLRGQDRTNPMFTEGLSVPPKSPSEQVAEQGWTRAT